MATESLNNRLEAFSDGVFAIAITLLVIDIKVPPIESIHSVNEVWKSLEHLWPSFFAFSLSFTIILISWIGHHNLLKGVDKTSAQFQVINGFFLLTVIFMPFPTSFMAEYLNTPYAQPAIVFFCLNAILHNIAWNALYLSILKPKPLLKDSINLEDIKKRQNGARYGFFIYLLIAVVAWWLPYVALVMTVIIWIYWLYSSIAFKHMGHEPTHTNQSSSK